jgi:hypothetical protein
MKFLVFIATSVFIFSAHAGLYGELNGLYNTDSFTTATTAAYSKTYYALDIHSNLENKNRFYGGFHVDQVTLTEQATAATTTTLTSLNMGPMLMWVMDHKKTFSLSAGYNVLANGTYTVTGSQSATLTGSGLWASLGVMPEISDNWFIGFRLTYYSLSYAKSTTGSAAADVSYSRTLIFPTFGLAWRY